MGMDSPLVSVIMPVYNAQFYLHNSIKSILEQSFADFEFIIIDDCSTDNSYTIMQRYAELDRRIIILKNKQNSKQAYCRNLGIYRASGKYLAFLDADDISIMDRLKIQVNFLENNSGITVCGSRVNFITVNNDITVNKIYYPLKHNEIKIYCTLFYNPIAQSSVMLRSDFLKANNMYYNEALGYIAEDFYLWINLIDKGAKFAILDQELVNYRVGDKNQTTAIFHDLLLQQDREMFKRQIFKISPNNIKLANLHYELFLKPTLQKISIFRRLKKLLLIQKFAKLKLEQ